MATKEKNEIRLEDQFTIQEPEKKAAGQEETSPDEDEDWGIQPDLGF